MLAAINRGMHNLPFSAYGTLTDLHLRHAYFVRPVRCSKVPEGTAVYT